MGLRFSHARLSPPRLCGRGTNTYLLYVLELGIMAKGLRARRPLVVLRRKKVIKKTLKTKSNAVRNATRSVARYPINGVGAVPRRNFGGNRGGNPLLCMDATIPRHLALPINVGPYTITRTTTIVKASETTIGFGFFRTRAFSAVESGGGTASTIGQSEGWSPIIGFAGGVGTSLSPASGTHFKGCPQLKELGASATLAPAALTVQVMNGNSLSGNEAAKGMTYCGASKTQMRLMDVGDSWDKIGRDFVSFQSPRMCSAAKLALRGVKMSARPFNIQELMDFDVIVPSDDQGNITWDDFQQPWTSDQTGTPGANQNQTYRLKGFSPIMVYNPNNEELQFAVTCEWRVRYNYGHPACSTHQVHPAASTRAWDMVQRSMDALGHGCIDIVEDVASAGADALRGAAVARVRGMFG